jgi:N-methylhydantoinase A
VCSTGQRSVRTRSSRDLALLLRRTSRAEHFNLWWRPPEALIRRSDIFEVQERLDYRGEVVTPFDDTEGVVVAREIARRGYEAVAIVFLHSFVNPSHELAMAKILDEECPGSFISPSHLVLPEILEFERTSTTVVNGYLGPVMRRYVGRLRDGASGNGYRGEVAISTSAGGIVSASRVTELPAVTLQSGPAAGVIAAAAISTAAGLGSVITLDMGGTSTDIGLLVEGEVRRTNRYDLEWGTPVQMPCVDITSIGAGGGSIAWIDPGGVLRCGPQSAGADPGPACYARGGELPTVTDAQLVLGRLESTALAAGRLSIREDLARIALAQLAEPLGFEDPIQVAAAVVRITTNNIVQALQRVTTFRGLDPREFTLLAFGGAGGQFAGAVAKEVNCRSAVVPPRSGLTSALGVVTMDVRHDLVRSLVVRADLVGGDEILSCYDELEREANHLLEREGVPLAARRLERLADLRYFGRTSFLTVVGTGAAGKASHGDRDTVSSTLVERFQSLHNAEYGYSLGPEVAPVEIVNLRVVGIGVTQGAGWIQHGRNDRGPVNWGPDETTHAHGGREVYFDGQYWSTAILERSELRAGDVIRAPAIIRQPDSTIVIEPGMHASIDAFENVVIES